jgi:hypothetical protein
VSGSSILPDAHASGGPAAGSARSAEIRAKAPCGERLSRAERVALCSDFLAAELGPLLKAGRVSTAVLNLA